MKKILFLTLIYLASPSYSADVTIDCTFETIESFTAGTFTLTTPLTPLYTCTLATSINSASDAFNVSGTHAATKINPDVKVFKKGGDVNLPVLPGGLEAIFTTLEGIYVEGFDFILLRNRDLTPFSGSLKYLSVVNTAVSFLEENLLDSLNELEIVDFSGSMISYVDASAFTSPAAGPSNFQILRLNDLILCDQPTSTPLSDEYTNDGTTDGIGNFITSLQSALVTTPCRTPTNLQNTLKNSILSSITEKTNADQFAADLSECQAELNDCKAAPVPETTEASQDTTQPIPNTTEPNPDPDTTLEPVDTTTQIASTCQAELEQALLNAANYKNSSEVCETEKAKLEDEIEDLEEQLTPVNGTCRFKDTDDGYTCSANKVSIKSTPEQRVKWAGTHINSKANADVKVLLIKSQSIQFMPLDVGKTFTNLIALTVDASGLTKLRRNDFVSLEKLQKVSIIGNEITSIESSTFDILTALIELNLSGNKLANLPTKAFDKLTSLTHLDLSDNKLTQLRFDLIPATNALKHFYARNNNLNTIDIIFVWRLNKADIIDFTGNKCDKKFDRGLLVESFTKDFFNVIVAEC